MKTAQKHIILSNLSFDQISESLKVNKTFFGIWISYPFFSELLVSFISLKE